MYIFYKRLLSDNVLLVTKYDKGLKAIILEQTCMVKQAVQTNKQHMATLHTM